MKQSQGQSLLDSSGACHFPAALSVRETEALRAIADRLSNRPGIRLHGEAHVSAIAGVDGVLWRIAADVIGAAARPVRAVLFDKSPRNNWVVPWHQDRTIAVRDRHEMTGYGPWSRKAGLWHVEPPFEITARMVTLRAHLDDCDENNAPLLYVPGSHRAGKLPAKSVAAFANERGHAISLARTGDVWAYATGIVHGSEAIRKPARRRVLQVDYSADELPGELEWMGI